MQLCNYLEKHLYPADPMEAELLQGFGSDGEGSGPTSFSLDKPEVFLHVLVSQTRDSRSCCDHKCNRCDCGVSFR